ncbi:hypothetical protein EVB55_187 [Rhizobium phage RHph_Y68]|uniref:Uncharacterized protein n=1 Tax=Rhizobium phage RHph_Y68 TaxID=2509787 RepID=A0A7S5QYB6_9CAUD|nr:hypothetical protein PP934_gp187 [Rhizobium phage RHph_Y68]QIG68122.1 hypothetical protein EVB55_187 [Rhizobium phage RHph_Y68]
MIKRTYTTTITKTVTISIDETKLTPEIIEEYNDQITWSGNTVEEHLLNIAEHYNRGNWWSGDTFLEGYGDLKEFDVKIVNEEFDDIHTEKSDY